MDISSVMALFSIVFGMVLGSFANVCIYRIPINKSIVNPPSSCPRCGERIKFYDNVPLFSYILLGGKCRHCSDRISFQYPLVEAFFGLMSWVLFIRYGLSYQYFLLLLFIGLLIIISIIDLYHKIIPDLLSIPGIIIGFGASFLLARTHWADSLIGIIAGGGVLFLVAVIFERITGKEGMGGGDVKLLAMIGGWMGWKSLPFILLMSSFSGVLIGGGALLLSGKSHRTRIPFGPFLSLGALIYLFFGSELIDWYYGLIR
jgi:leader peptidase (prepilin peptidase)/N-methyltransferase